MENSTARNIREEAEVNTVREAAIESVKTAPPLGVVGVTLAGIPLQEWVYSLTILWLSIQIGWWGYSRYKEYKRNN